MKPVILVAIVASVVSIPTLGQGLTLLRDSAKANYDFVEVGEVGYASLLPSNHDMLKYAPSVMMQEGATCVGFSVAYCAHSTMINKATETTDELHKNIMSFDPYFIYSIINSTREGSCEHGLDFPSCFEVMVNLGDMRSVYPPVLDCEFSWLESRTGNFDPALEVLAAASMPFRITDFMQVDLNQDDALFVIKYLISNDIPVIVGARINNDFSPSFLGGQIDTNGVWNYTASSDEALMGHAMCILGYDDDQFGGSFLVRNSWGSEFGSQGNVWLKYENVEDVISEAWCILPDFWDEFVFEPHEYGFNMQDTGFEGIEYKRVTSRDGESSYEGFYAEDTRVYAFEALRSGCVYFGEWVNFVKDGNGILWTAEGGVYNLTFDNGELLDGAQLGFENSAANASDVINAYIEDLGVDQRLQFDDKFELSGRFE